MAEGTQLRSFTDPPPSEEHQNHRPHISRRRLHANSFRSKGQWGSGSHHQLRQDTKTTQSATELKPPINFDHLRRKDHRASALNARSTTSAQPASLATSALPTIATEQPVRPLDVAKAKRHNVKREVELRAEFKSVEEIGRNSTRELDETYYGILEKAAVLRSTIASLQLLADESKRMHTVFTEETSRLESDTAENVRGFGNFDQQEQTINELVAMLHQSRSTTGALNERLESARLRVESYERRDNAKQAKRRVQWRITWIASLAVAVLVIVILVARDRERVSDVVEQQLLRIGDLVDDVAAPIRLRPSPSEDPYLQRLFDEL